ncbi:MAG: hypothetical protein KDA28_06295, partial [Phycisphaerales bacterium]|nr:hypothetical protein [Phycisphaerales bacterium]
MLTLTVSLCLTTTSLPATPPDYDFQWATISDVGNPGYLGPGDFNMSILGRGDVDYIYRISKNEVSTAQWIELINTFAADDAQFAREHGFFSSWGAAFDPDYNGPGRRFVLRTDIADA